MTYLLYLREPGRKTGGPVTAGYLENTADGTSGRPAEDSLARASSVTFLFHGFNVDRDEGKVSLEGTASHLTSHPDAAIVGVLWPGDHWVGFLSYPFEGGTADDSALELVRFIERVVQKGASLSFVTHSLGTRVALEAIDRLALINDVSAVPYALSRACLMAAAVNDFSLAEDERYESAVESCERVAVLSSKRDRVLRFAYPAGNLLHSFIHWDREAGFALGYGGPKKLPPNAVSHEPIPKKRKSRHGHYLPDFPLGGGDMNERSDRNRVSAAEYADAFLKGSSNPDYG